MNIIRKHTGLIIHVTAWAVLFGMPLFFTNPNTPAITSAEYIRFLTIPLSFMLVFYINYFKLIERYIFRKQVGKFLLINVVLIAATVIGVHLLFRYVLPHDAAHPPVDRPWQESIRFFFGNSVFYILLAGVSVAVRMTSSWYEAENKRKELEHSRTQAELLNLKNQLNPHFLFNTLNNIYSLIQIDTERAQVAVHDLSRLLRYVLYDSSRQEVSLEEEMNFLRNYIELMKIRLPKHVTVSVSLTDEKPGAGIAPLLFISLIENAFKHGVSNETRSFISIDIHFEGNSLVCLIRNSFFPKPACDKSGSGIGLANLEKRLGMIYPGRYRFTRGEKDGEYIAALTIDLGGLQMPQKTDN